MMATTTNPFNLDFYVCIIVMKLDMKNGAKWKLLLYSTKAMITLGFGRTTNYHSE